MINVTEPRPPTVEEVCAEIIECDDVLGLFAADWRRLVAGEEKNAKLLYLVATSRLLDRTMHAAIKGPSSAGKSEIRARVLQFIPPESVISFSSLSERALIYSDDDFEHKVLSMGEAAGAEEESLQNYLLRELMSEGRLRYQTVQKAGKAMETIVIEKTGPVAFMVTTTKHRLHAENETRLLSLEIDDSEAQTRAVLAKVAEVEGLNSTTGVDFEPWHEFQRWLEDGPCEVVVPYATALAAAVPPRSVRLRRDLGQVIRAIKSHALLHRQHRDRDGAGRVVATIHDYAVVRDLMHDLLQETSEVKIKRVTLETIAAVEQATAGLPAEEGATATAVGKILRLDKSAALRRLRAAQDDEHVINLETKPGRPGRYRASGASVETVTMLPLPASLKALIPATPENQCNPATESQNPIQDKEMAIATEVAPPQPVACNLPAVAAGLCNPRPVDTVDGSPDGCTVAADSGGYGDDDGDQSERDAIQAMDDLDIPAWLDRRAR